MRKIRGMEVLTFVSIFVLVAVLALLTNSLTFGRIAAGDFRGVLLVLTFALLSYGYALAAYRLFLSAYPLKEGDIAAGSREEFGYHVYLLFNLILFYPLIRSSFLPVPLLRLLYQCLGARLGANTYSSGIMFDAPLIHIGRDCIVGQSSMLIPHVIEGHRLAHYAIRIGDNVTIGAQAVVLAGVSIGADAIVAIGAVVPKGTVIGAGEIWGGMPARKLSDRS